MKKLSDPIGFPLKVTEILPWYTFLIYLMSNVETLPRFPYTYLWIIFDLPLMIVHKTKKTPLKN
jgi:hypothetical protein